MIDELLTDKLVTLVMGWRLAPGRYIQTGRGWSPRSRFRPLVELRDAFRLLTTASDDYCLVAKPGGVFTAEVRLAGRTGKASGESPSRTITMALARALQIEPPVEDVGSDSAPTRRGPVSGGKIDGV